VTKSKSRGLVTFMAVLDAANKLPRPKRPARAMRRNGRSLTDAERRKVALAVFGPFDGDEADKVSKYGQSDDLIAIVDASSSVDLILEAAAFYGRSRWVHVVMTDPKNILLKSSADVDRLLLSNPNAPVKQMSHSWDDDWYCILENELLPMEMLMDPEFGERLARYLVTGATASAYYKYRKLDKKEVEDDGDATVGSSHLMKRRLNTLEWYLNLSPLDFSSYSQRPFLENEIKAFMRGFTRLTTADALLDLNLDYTQFVKLVALLRDTFNHFVDKHEKLKKDALAKMSKAELSKLKNDVSI